MATPNMVAKFLSVYVKLFHRSGDIAVSVFPQEVSTVIFFDKIYSSL